MTTTQHDAEAHAEKACFRARCASCGWVGRKYRDEWKAKHYAARHNVRLNKIGATR